MMETSNESYPIAHLTEKEEQKIRQLETELGVVLIAYEDNQERE